MERSFAEIAQQIAIMCVIAADIRETIMKSVFFVMKNAAIKYKEKGFAVIPLVPLDKKPLGEMLDLPKLPQPTEEQLVKWFKNTNNNIGIRCGKVSGIIAVDVDLKDLIKENKAKPWEEITGLPPTLRAKTTNGGWHYIYLYKEFPSLKGKQHPEINVVKTISG